MQYKVKDSGTRQEFTTGAVRDIQQGKGRYDLITPVALRRLAKHYENGAAKYGDSNWAKGIPLRRIADSAIRHLFNYLEGDRSEDHIIACAWNCFAIAHTEEMIMNGTLGGELVDGLPCYIPEDKMDDITKEWWSIMKKRLKDVKDKNRETK